MCRIIEIFFFLGHAKLGLNLISQVKYPTGTPEILHRDARPGKLRVGKTSGNCSSKGGHIVPVSQSANHREGRELPGGKNWMRMHRLD